SAFAIRASRGPIPMRWISSALAIGALIIGYIGVFHRPEFTGTNWFMHTIGVTGFALLSGGLIGLSQHRIQGLRRVLDMGWLRATGKYSYGMYVYHLPLYVLIDHFLFRVFGMNAVLPLVYALPYIAFLLAGTYLIAKLSFDLFESKALAWKKHFRPEAPAPRTIAEPAEAVR
ncbi:MAG TPA: acyltransferase family protein, partial [Acidobacteriaceae bacterium]|nr:acyltransferase family protein [Acidobacteriaceae bacterium]